MVIEGSAAVESWPAHLGAPPEQGWSVVEQEEWEPGDTFLGRVGGALEDCAREAESSLVVVLIAGSWVDEATNASRARLANDIVWNLARAGGGTLLLSHGHLHDAELRSELSLLASDLAEEWTDGSVAVRTRFARPSRLPEPRKASEYPRAYGLEPIAAAR